MARLIQSDKYPNISKTLKYFLTSYVNRDIMYIRSQEVHNIKEEVKMKDAKWIEVQITIDGETFEDAVLAQNEKQALQVAYWNWELATDIKVI